MCNPKCLTIVGLLMISAVLAYPWIGLAGDVQFPSSVQADGHGRWVVNIIVSGTDNPGFRDAGTPVNTSVYSTQTQLPDGTFEITLGGQLIDKTRDGSVRFFVDPNGAGYPQAITILHGNPTAFLDLHAGWNMISSPVGHRTS